MLISFVLVQGVATAALTRAVADNYLGRKTDMLEAYQRVGSSWVRLIGVIILMVFVYIALSIWLIVPCVGWISGPGILVYVAGVIGPLIAPVVVLEHMGAGAHPQGLGACAAAFLVGAGFHDYPDGFQPADCRRPFRIGQYFPDICPQESGNSEL